MPEYLKARLVSELALHFGPDARRMDHALEVLAHAEALLEATPEADREVVVAAALTHDFGIVEAERLHGASNGKLQEKYGPALVRPALRRAGLDEARVREVSRIVARHHSPPPRPSLNFRLLYESDWLVNVRDYPAILADRKRTENFIEKNFITPAGLARARTLLLGEADLFSEMGGVYKLLINEPRRREAEAPFLFETAERARRIGPAARRKPKASTQILDLACGTGFHARLMAEAGYPVLAIDRSESMLEAARERAMPKNLEYVRGDLLEPLPVARPASLALLLGNTLSTLRDLASVGHALRRTADALRPGGLLLCQVLNCERLRQEEGRCVRRHGLVGGRETVLAKTLQVLEDGSVLIAMVAAQPGARDEWESSSRTSRLLALGPAQLKACARTAGLRLEGSWGNLAEEPYSAETSSDFVALFSRQN